jgi:hypothetical protein
MDTAIAYTELMNSLVDTLLKSSQSVQVLKGRRFDRISTDDSVRFFVDRHSWIIYGAKSSFQYNPRREYGSLNTVEQYDWATSLPLPNTEADKAWQEREAEIAKNYKPRGRPRKNPVGTP